MQKMDGAPECHYFNVFLQYACSSFPERTHVAYVVPSYTNFTHIQREDMQEYETAISFVQPTWLSFPISL